MKQIQASFLAAVETLIGDGSVKQRLARAFELHLTGVDLSELPPSVRKDYDVLHTALHTAAPIGPQSRVSATVQKMSSADATGHALTILSIHMRLEERAERSEPLRVTEPLQFAERAIAAAPRYLDKRN
jgi:hypothetical protein